MPLSLGAAFALLLALALLYTSGFVSASEIAFFSLSPSDLNDIEEENHPYDSKIKALLDDSERLLATILISNNFVNVTIIMLLNYVFASVIDFGEAKILEFLIVTVVLTFLLLLFGEIMPKIYSAQHTLPFARKAAPVVTVLRTVFWPISSLLVRSSFFINRFSQKRKVRNLSVNELSQALELTDIQETPEENNMLEGIIRFGEETAKEVMTSRLDIVDLEIHSTFSEVLKCINENGYSRIPVYEETRDHIKGILYIKDLLPYLDKKVKEYDFNYAIHLHGPDMPLYPDADDVWENVKDLDPRIGMCLDIGHDRRNGKDPVADLEKYISRVFDIHLKDVTGASKAGYSVEVGRGILDIPGFVRMLRKTGYDGVVSLEHERNMKDPFIGIAESIGYFRGVVATTSDRQK